VVMRVRRLAKQQRESTATFGLDRGQARGRGRRILAQRGQPKQMEFFELSTRRRVFPAVPLALEPPRPSPAAPWRRRLGERLGSAVPAVRVPAAAGLAAEEARGDARLGEKRRAGISAPRSTAGTSTSSPRAPRRARPVIRPNGPRRKPAASTRMRSMVAKSATPSASTRSDSGTKARPAWLTMKPGVSLQLRVCRSAWQAP